MRRIGKNKRGFTLVELMIVVAIVGVLAALAIYGVNKYVKNAKTTEARASVARIAKDATTAYSRPKMAGDVMAPGDSTASSVMLCKSAAAKVPAAAAAIAGSKYQSQASEWNAGAADTGWACLRFSMTDPQYYMYGYTATVAGGAGDVFTASAEGDLDGDGTLSSFSLRGEVSPAANDLELLVSPNIIETNPDE